MEYKCYYVGTFFTVKHKNKKTINKLRIHFQTRKGASKKKISVEDSSCVLNI